MRIEVLGPLRVHDDAARPVKVGGPRVRALLVALALAAGRPVPADVLAARLWEENPPADPRAALQALVSRLRAALRRAGLDDALIETGPAGYRLLAGPKTLDAVQFEDLAERGARALAGGQPGEAAGLLRQALALWRGHALADVGGSSLTEAAAGRLEQLRRRAVLDRIEADLASAAASDAESLAAELVPLMAEEPLAERPRALAMRALYLAGRQAAALGVYAEARTLLAERLGVDPSPQLAEVHLAVLQQTLHDGRAALSSEQVVPRAGLTSFVGRDDDVATVAGMLAQGRLVTLTGPGGSGKTRLATEVAAAVPRRAGEVCMVELAPLDDAAEVPNAAMAALGMTGFRLLRPSPAGRPAGETYARLVSALAGRRVLLVLDNCEHLIDAAAVLADRLLAGCPGVRVLATSREPLGIAGEVVWPVRPLPVPRDGSAASAGETSRNPAVCLLRDRAAAASPGFGVTPANVADVVRICRAVDGVPLAIELAAARLRSLSAAQLADRLSERMSGRFGLLTGGSRTAAARHQTLRAVEDWSWGLLEPGERALARRIAVFPSGVTLQAAEEACADLDGVVDGIRGLVDKSFLTVEEGAGDAEPRYRMLQTIRAYCLERLAEAGQETKARSAMSDYFLRLAERADPLLRSSQQRRWHNLLVAENENIHAALRWAIDRRDGPVALVFARSLGWYWMLHQQHGETSALAAEILALADGAPPAARGLAEAEGAAICAMIALSATVQGEMQLGPLRAALAAVRDISRGRQEHPIVIVARAIVATVEHDDDRALGELEAHFDAPDPWLRAGTSLMHSFLAFNFGRMPEAAAGCERALAGFRELGEVWGTAMALLQRSELARLRGDFAVAIASLEEAIALGRDLSAWADLPYLHSNLAGMRARAGDFRGARADLDLAARTLGRQPEAGQLVALTVAEVAWQEGRLQDALAACERLVAGLSGYTALTWLPLRAQAQARLAVLALQAGGDPGRPRELLSGALAAAAESRDRPAAATVVEAVARLAVHAGDERRAATLLGAADAVRGVADGGSLDAADVRAAALLALGAAAVDECYQRGQGLAYDEALRFAGQVLRR